jgi:hypothetical protein
VGDQPRLHGDGGGGREPSLVVGGRQVVPPLHALDGVPERRGVGVGHLGHRRERKGARQALPVVMEHGLVGLDLYCPEPVLPAQIVHAVHDGHPATPSWSVLDALDAPDSLLVGVVRVSQLTGGSSSALGTESRRRPSAGSSRAWSSCPTTPAITTYTSASCTACRHIWAGCWSRAPK